MKKWGMEHSNAVFLCDDDNDMPLAAVVGKAFLPTVSSVRARDVAGSWPQSACCQQHNLTRVIEYVRADVRGHVSVYGFL